MSVVIFSRKRRLAKRHLAHTGRGLFLGSFLVLAGLVALPFFLKPGFKPDQIVNFSDLLRVAADEAPAITEQTYFSLYIPKIGVEAKIFPNIDPADKTQYAPVLKQGIAHALGTFFPGSNGNIVLFAHSTDSLANVALFNAVFYRLDELITGDQVTVWYLGKKHDYRITGRQIVGPNNVEVFHRQPGQEKLYLITCTPRGTTQNRLIIEAQVGSHLVDLSDVEKRLPDF